jgi:hypothetical protein
MNHCDEPELSKPPVNIIPVDRDSDVEFQERFQNQPPTRIRQFEFPNKPPQMQARNRMGRAFGSDPSIPDDHSMVGMAYFLNLLGPPTKPEFCRRESGPIQWRRRLMAV